MGDREYVDLLIVDIEVGLEVVECAPYEALEGNLVEFHCGGRDVIGTVVKRMHCEKDAEEYDFLSEIHTIHQAEKVWRRTWSREIAENG